MSIILDALKKSETERQQQGNTEFGQVPLRTSQRSTPVWIWVVAILLAINLIVLLVMVFRPASQSVVETPPAREAPPVITTPAGAEPASSSFAEQLEQVEPVSTNAPVTAMPAAPPEPAETVTNPPRATVVEQLTSSDTDLPDVDQLRANGQLPIGEQRLDIHVYSASPANRFVFINMTKLRQGETNNDGVTVEEITRDGVILNYQGRRFFQARQ